ncbi:MAG: D-TA family PLP-dependent enzyme [Planctomycetaceae bacterium]
MLSVPEFDVSVLQDVASPSVVVFVDVVRRNIDRMISVAGRADRLRPHCKTHKMSAIIRLLLEKGIQRHKAATIAEAEMLAQSGARDVVLAYNIVGPNLRRVAEFRKLYPDTQLVVTADHPGPVQQLGDLLAAEGLTVGVMLDVDPGLHRTGIAPTDDRAMEVYGLIHRHPALRPAGFHVYDGHHKHSDLNERRAAVMKEWPEILVLKQRCEQAGYSVPELLCGGTPTFPVYAELDEPGLTLSPGTSIFHDAGYGTAFPDLNFQPAAVVITRVISRPTSNRVTLDLGNKAVAADPPNGRRVWFPELPDAVHVLHNEEHLVLETDAAARFQPGDLLIGIPIHICPTSALHHDVTTVENGHITGHWDVTARNRKLTV